MGFWEAWQRFGRLEWKDLFQDAVRMCEEGFTVGKILADELNVAEFLEKADNKNNMRRDSDKR